MSSVATPVDGARQEAPERTAREAWLRPARAAAGPALIVLAVVMVLWPVLARGMGTNEDLVRYWMPEFGFLGRALRAGHVPAWNPFAFSGSPFAADPQTGWMSFPPMLLFTLFRPDVAIRYLTGLLPMIAGLGLYAFLRSEGLSRPAATVGGLVLAVPMASSTLAVTIRFPGMLAWSAVLLATTSRYVRASRWSGRLAWAGLSGLAWMQIAAAHPTAGLIIGSLPVAGLVAAKVVTNLRSHRWSAGEAARILVVLAMALPLVSLAYFLPRLALAPRLDLAQGYRHLWDVSGRLGQSVAPHYPGPGAPAAWALNLAIGRGRYLGAAPLLLVLGGLWSRRWRPLAVAFAVVGAALFLVGLDPVSRNVPTALRRVGVIDQYLHKPFWFAFGVLPAIAVLGALGIEAWREASRRDRVAMALPGVLIWLVVPLAFGAGLGMWLLVVGGVAGFAVLAASLRRAAVLVVLPAVVVAELFGAALVDRAGATGVTQLAVLNPLAAQTPTADWRRPTAISSSLDAHPGDRYISIGRATEDAYAALQNMEAMTFRIENTGGYAAVQLARYWSFLRTLQPNVDMPYNYAQIPALPPAALDALDIGWIVSSRRSPPEPGAALVAHDGTWRLYRRAKVPGRASVMGSWTVAGGAEPALADVAHPGFEPASEVVLERDPEIAPGGALGLGAASAMYVAEGDQAATVRVETPAAAVVLVRNVWDPHWHATVDGRPAPVIPADSVVQAVPVPAGNHTIRLTYDDPTIGLGALASGVALAGLFGAAAVLRRRDRHRAGSPTAPAPPA
jgi:hypothetical protein